MTKTNWRLPVGLMCNAVAFASPHLFTLPDFVQGFLLSFGTAMLLCSLVKARKRKQQEAV